MRRFLDVARCAHGPKELERLWSEHLEAEFGTKDVEATLATMVDDAFVNHVPVSTGGRGREELRAFYRRAAGALSAPEACSELGSRPVG